MLRSLILCLSLLAILAACDQDIIELNDFNINETLAKYEIVMVKFYAPWDTHGKEMEKEYQKLADQTKEKGWVIAQLDATANPISSKYFEIFGYPTIKLFYKNESFTYKGDRRAQYFQAFIVSKTTLPEELNNEAEVKKVLESSNVVIVAMEKDSPEFKELCKTHHKVDYIHFYYTSKPALIKAQKMPTLILYTSHAKDGLKFEGNFTSSAMIKFVKDNSRPIVWKLSQLSVGLLFGNANPGVALFYDSDKLESKQLVADFKKLATVKRDPNIYFLTSEIKEGMGKKVANFIGLYPEELPSIQALHPKEDLYKYIMDPKIPPTFDNMVKFFEEWRAGKIPRSHKSERIPESFEGDNYFKLVEKNFQNIVLNDTSKDVLVKFCAPSGYFCEKEKDMFPKLAKKTEEDKDFDHC
eukprot:TRINITY_DN1685_c0_g1_i2.p1 TRINITY_DN1685_c0_g1~~TRINITY_DN1685_c0_g1_i2.p1  ORF type:complete len:412 (+),score=68.64 TRINITY_DN1685_c0_g1_i2:1-1236(+)